MEELVLVNAENMTVSARELHEKLEIKTAFKDWMPRMIDYGFEENKDFNSLKKERVQIEGSREVKREILDFNISIDMAKQICMIQRTEIGKRIRQYFLDLEKAWNTPEQVMARALKIADHTIAELSTRVQELQPKADYFDALVDRNLLTNFRDTAKELGVKQKVFITYLENHNYIYRDSHGNIRPYADKNKGLFELKEFANGDFTGVQTLVTPRGRETFRLLLEDKIQKGE